MAGKQQQTKNEATNKQNPAAQPQQSNPAPGFSPDYLSELPLLTSQTQHQPETDPART
jgi:hypothetical protein